VAYKLVAGYLLPSDITSSLASSSSSSAASATPQGTILGDGIFSWWKESSTAAEIGLPISPSPAAGSSVAQCLTACTEESQCALVFFEFAEGRSSSSSSSSSSSVVRCELRQGMDGYGTPVRSLLRTRISAADAP
jgi:hypothetical protein